LRLPPHRQSVDAGACFIKPGLPHRLLKLVLTGGLGFLLVLLGGVGEELDPQRERVDPVVERQ